MSSRKAVRRVLVRLIAVFIGLAAVCTVLILVEICVRAALPPRNPLRLFTKPITVEFIVDAGTPVMNYDAGLTFRLKPGLRDAVWAWTRFNTNSLGIRRDADVGPKAPGSVRILCFGDSCTFGFGVPMVMDPATPSGPERCYADVLETSLRTAFPGREIEVINMGVPGYGSAHGIEWMERMLPELRPDFVTVAFFTNDVVSPGLSARQTLPQTAFQKAVRHTAAHSQALVHFMEWQKRRFPGTPPAGLDTSFTTIEDYIANHERMRRLCAENGAQFVLINPFFRDAVVDEAALAPVRIRQFRAAITAYARASQVPFVDIPEVTEANWPASDKLFMERVHPNGAGHALIAERLHGFFAARIAGAISPKGQ